jgi:hypothetical protein
MLSKLTTTLAALTLLTAAGCNGSYEGLIPVSGKVTFDGGAPPAGGFLSFMPLDRVEGKPSRPGRATFLTDGAYEAMSFEEGDGLYPGRYGVLVRCDKTNIDYGNPNAVRNGSYVADGYEAEPLVIEEGSDEVVFNLDVPLRKTR